ncbi:MAG: alpha-L-fucosidase [Verrucomicrobia bacterium]|nr:alpha-L-fucosidase [Verrucomicrobiota bacterium]
MTKLLSKPEYERATAATRNERMAWWREARYGMFVHFGLYALLGRNEWAMALESIPVEEYEKLADRFNPKPGAPRQWAALAKKAGMKYMVLTTRHHEGFSLWDSKVNPFNSVNLGPKRDIVREFVDACREVDLKIGFYSSLMDWRHPDGGRCAYDSAARKRFLDYIEALNVELLSNYGKIDILWYDVPRPLETHEGWNSLERNQRLRELQPHILINNRSRLDEDFGTPEEHITPSDKDWEACMTFNGLSWGHMDSEQVIPYSYNAHRILKMLNTVTVAGGNLLLNIGPTPEGDVPVEAVEPLTAVGNWLGENGAAVYGKKLKYGFPHFNGLCGVSFEGRKVHIWNWIWPKEGELILGGFKTKLVAASLVKDGSPVAFEQQGHRIWLKNLPAKSPDTHLGIAVFELAFEADPVYRFVADFPQFHTGEVF